MRVSSSSGHLDVEWALFRQYLARGSPQSGQQVLEDALVHGEPGARYLVRMGLEVRVNRRTRRTMQNVRVAHRMRGRLSCTWYRVLCNGVFALFRTLRRLAVPSRAHGVHPSRLCLSQGSARALVPTGTVYRDRTTLLQRASEAVRARQQDVQGKQLVLWLDNWYWEVYQADPQFPNVSQNVSAWAVLVVDNQTGSRLTTRSLRFPEWGGHSTVLQLFREVDSLAANLVQTVPELGRRLDRMDQCGITRQQIRVPLDVQRPQVRSLQWQPWALSQLTVSSNLDLLKLMQEARFLQVTSTHTLPLLVDENVHYRLARFLYGSSYHPWDMAGYLSRIPVPYGVWHPYKHCLTVVYRSSSRCWRTWKQWKHLWWAAACEPTARCCTWRRCLPPSC